MATASVARPAGSSLELEDALERVVALDVEVDAERLMLRAIPGRFSDKHRRAGHRREDRVRKRRGDAGGTLVGLQLGISGLADLDRALAAMHVEGDRRALDGN